MFPALNYTFRNIAFSNVRKYIEANTRECKNKFVVHYTNQFSGIFRIRGAETVINIHDSPYYTDNLTTSVKFYMLRLYHSLKNENFILTDTNYLKRELEEFGFTGNIVKIYLPYSDSFKHLEIQKDDLRQELNLPINKKLILSVSTDALRKNLPVVKKVIDLLGDKYRLVRVGKPLGNSINFTKIDDSILNKLYNACDLLIFPSLYEGFGLPVVEAFATGLPVVSSDIPTIKEVAGSAAILANPNDVDDMKEGVLRALEQPEYFSMLGIKRASQFSLVQFKKEITSFYKKFDLGNIKQI